MLEKIYKELTSLSKILCLISNSLNYKIYDNKIKNKPIEDLQTFLSLIEKSIAFIPDAPLYIPTNNDNVIFLQELTKKIKDSNFTSYDPDISKILKNSNDLTIQLKDFLKIFTTNQTNNIDTTSNEYSNFINNIRSFKILAETQSFSDTSRIEIEGIKNNLHKTINRYTEINKIYEEISEKNKKYSEEIDADSNRSLKLLYEEIYKTEIRQADGFRKLTIIILIFVALIVLSIICMGLLQNLLFLIDSVHYQPVEYNISHLIRFISIFSLTVPAWYFARESNKHRLVAYKAKILGTELGAFPYYVRELENVERIKMRTALADKFFGQELYSDKNTSSTNNNEQSKLTLEALKTVTSLLPKKPE